MVFLSPENVLHNSFLNHFVALFGTGMKDALFLAIQ